MISLEKAKYLIEEMKGECCRCPHDSKLAAIICCDEVIKSHEEAKDDGNLKWKWAIIFWKSVKIEIEKL